MATDRVDPSSSYTWKWLVEKDTYLLKLVNLPAGLKPEDLLVRVDGKRRLTVAITDRRKQPTPGGEAPAPRLNNKFRFQLPKTANLDAITGCFNGVELTLTVPFAHKPPLAVPNNNKGQQLPAVTVTAGKEEPEPEPEPEPKAKAEREKELMDTAVAALTLGVAFTLGVVFSRRLFASRS